MRIKSILLASTCALASLSAVPAQADGFYTGVFGGANFASSEDGFFHGKRSTTGRAHFDPDTGFLLGGSLGYELTHWVEGLSVELEASHRYNRLGGHWEENRLSLLSLDAQAQVLPTTSGDISGYMSTSALMANVWYEFNLGSRFKPYIGGGAGWAQTRLKAQFEEQNVVLTALTVTNPFRGIDVREDGFAFQLGAGVTTLIMPGLHIGVGYRYFNGPDIKLFLEDGSVLPSLTALSGPGGNGDFKFDNAQQAVVMTLTADID